MKKKISMSAASKKRTIEEGFSEFIRSCRVKNLSEKTIKFYEEYMKQFQSFTNSLSLVFIEDIQQSVIENYILYLKDSNKYKDITINTNLRAIRAIIYYYQRLGYCEKFNIQLIKANKDIKETYSEYELKLLLKKSETEQFNEYRNWVIINFLIATGVRVGELVNIQVKDIDFNDAIVKIKTGKSRRERHIPLSWTLFKVLAEYLEIRKYEDLEDYLFCNSFGQKLNEDSCKHAIARYNRSKGIEKTSIHLFRHTFAKMFILNGGDLFRLQKVLGHKSIEIVREYVNMFTDDLKLDFNTFNPLESICNHSQYKKMK